MFAFGLFVLTGLVTILEEVTEKVVSGSTPNSNEGFREIYDVLKETASEQGAIRHDHVSLPRPEEPSVDERKFVK